MNLNQKKWTLELGKNFSSFLQQHARPEKVDWMRKIVNTQMPLLAISMPELRKIVKQIQQGDMFSFLDLALANSFEEVAIRGILLSQIKDLKIVKQYLVAYFEVVDNWALCDCLKFSITKENEKDWWDFSGKLLQENQCFKRRIAIIIMFQFINENYLAEIFKRLEFLKEEKEYYVNMAAAWLLAECFVKQREKTLYFLQTQRESLNIFILNKGIQKCRDSFRVTKEDKNYLLSLKRN